MEAREKKAPAGEIGAGHSGYASPACEAGPSCPAPNSLAPPVPGCECFVSGSSSAARPLRQHTHHSARPRDPRNDPARFDFASFLQWHAGPVRAHGQATVLVPARLGLSVRPHLASPGQTQVPLCSKPPQLRHPLRRTPGVGDPAASSFQRPGSLNITASCVQPGLPRLSRSLLPAPRARAGQ